MRFFILILAIFVSVQAKQVVLNGKDLTIQDVYDISLGENVKIDKKALDRVSRSHDALIEAAKQGHKIYGLTVGVGLNKDKQFVDAHGNLDDEVIKASKKFNIGLIHAHCGGVYEDLKPNVVRAIMAIRLNNMLYGGSGVSLELVKTYEAFLNNNIIPAVPSKGSVGEADITILGHIGLAMLGEGFVYVDGEKIPASAALSKFNIKKIEPFGKDALSIISSNSYSSALAVLTMQDLKNLIKNLKLVYALSLEGLNGNVAPFLEESVKLRPFPQLLLTAKDLRELLKGSYLWENSSKRALQDPLSYRDGVYQIAALESSLKTLEDLMKIQLNSSDDNPGVNLDVSTPKNSYQEKFFVKNGKSAVVPNSNFEPLLWVFELEKMSIVLGFNSKASSQRIIKLDDDYFTGLSRFLGTDETIHAFGAMQKPFAALDAENQLLANPVSLNWLPLAGNIEDIATNAPLAAIKLQKQIDNFYYILGMELLHAAQAIDLRMKEDPNLKLSVKTKKLFEQYRKQVEFLQVDRPLTEDFRKSYDFLKNYSY